MGASLSTTTPVRALDLPPPPLLGLPPPPPPLSLITALFPPPTHPPATTAPAISPPLLSAAAATVPLVVTVTAAETIPLLVTVTAEAGPEVVTITAETTKDILITVTTSVPTTESLAISSAIPSIESTLTSAAVLSATGTATPGGAALISAAAISAAAETQSSTLESLLSSTLFSTTEPTALPAGSPNAAPQPNIGQKQLLRGPFTPEVAFLGTIPTIKLDVPITAVFLALFMIGAATHFTIHERNKKRGHKFDISDMVFDFCMVRTVTCTMRIVWAFRPANNSIVLAALIFENAGVVVLFAVNIFFTNRILRAVHPIFGWNKGVRKFFLILLLSVPGIIVYNITVLTISFFVTTAKAREITRGFLLFGSSYTLFLSVFPLIVTALVGAIPSPTPVENFGVGRFRFKVMLLIFSASVLVVGAVVRLVSSVQVHPADQPGGIDGKALFYTTGFMLEILVVFIYAVTRIDLLFHVPNGSNGPGDYGVGSKQEDQESFFTGDEKRTLSTDSTIQAPPSIWDSKSQMEPQAQVRQAVRDMERTLGIEGKHLETRYSEVMLYEFKVKSGVEPQVGPERTSIRPPSIQNGVKPTIPTYYTSPQPRGDPSLIPQGLQLARSEEYMDPSVPPQRYMNSNDAAWEENQRPPMQY